MSISDESAPVLIAAPGSLAPVRDALAAAFARDAAPATLTFGPPAYSGVLAANLLAGEPADLFISANVAYLDQLLAAGLATEPAILAGNALALMVHPSRLAPPPSLADVLAPGWRLALPPAATDPLGQYAVTMFDRAGLSAALAAKRERGEILSSLPQVPSLFARDALDAAIVYRTAVPALASVAREVPLPASLALGSEITFAVGIIQRAGRGHPAALAARAFLLGPVGQAILASAGFLPHARVGAWP